MRFTNVFFRKLGHTHKTQVRKGSGIKGLTDPDEAKVLRPTQPFRTNHPHRIARMEGLIPLIYKAIKDRRSASAGDGAAPIVDLEDPEQRRWWLQQELRSPVHAASSAQGQQQEAHRRNRSLEELAGEVGPSSDRRVRVPLPKARSIRAFSCIAGAV
jgi:hypothetical protein